MPYSRNDLLLVMIKAFNFYIVQCADGPNILNEGIERLEGAEQIPVMRLYQSKELGYNTIAFRSFEYQSVLDESKCGECGTHSNILRRAH